MIQCAVWSWYDKLLNSYDRRTVIKPVPSPLATIKTLLAHGSNAHSETSPIHTLLRGLLLNLIQFDGEERPPEVMRECMSRWLELVQELGFNLKDYLRTEAKIHKGRCYKMGLGIQMTICFDEANLPHIWTVFQGPLEREMNIYMDRISKCAIWKEWRALYSLPKPPPPPKVQELSGWSAEIILVKKQCGCPSFDTHLKSCEGSSKENKHETELSRSLPSTFASTTPSKKCRIVSMILYYMISARRYRHEFTFYVFVLACFFGFSYFTRFWITGFFFLALKLFQDTISYWI